jgi:cobalt/nickel transport system permease protein
MSDISARIRELREIEKLSLGQTAVHRIHVFTKLLMTFVFIVLVVSFGRYDFLRLTPYLFYPFVMMALAELPYKTLLTRVLIVLPFCLFAGITNAIIDREPAFIISGFAVSYGLLSLATILLKMYLCVMAALILVATTPFTEITAQLQRFYVPMVFVMVFEMTFRYIGVLFEEVFSMITAYRLRRGNNKSLEMRHMGSFVGQLFLRGIDRAERVHAAMCCRGYSLKNIPAVRRRLTFADIVILGAVCVLPVILRFITVW